MATLAQSLRTAKAYPHPGRRMAVPCLLAALALVACGGGGGQSADLPDPPSVETPPDPPSTGTPSTPPVRGSGKVVAIVRDVLQAPLPYAVLYLATEWPDADQDAVADANGRAEFENVPESFSVHVRSPDWSSMNLSGTLEGTVGAGEVKQVEVIASPVFHPAGGIAGASVTAGGVSEDGRTMELSLKVIQAMHPAHPDDLYSVERIGVQPCIPDTSNDMPQHRADCISGADGFDAPYEPGKISLIRQQTTGSEQGTPYIAALLVDQSAGVIVDDPEDARLFAAKYFLTYASADSPKALAAFASHDPGSAGFSLLPTQPVSFFPVEDPQFSSNGPAYFPTVDALRTMEGGGAPLYAALDKALDFVNANRTGRARAVVVISSGRDDTCGSRTECRAMRDAVIRKSKAADIAIVTVGVPAANGDADREALGLLAQSTPRGAAFWAENPEQLAMTVSRAHSYLALQKNLLQKDVIEVTLQIQTSVVGAFTSGRTVLGTLTLEAPPWACLGDCYRTKVPFVVRIP